MTSSFRVDAGRQGPTGVGQGGWTAHRFADRIGRPVTVSIHAPIPLDTDLELSTADGGVANDRERAEWSLVAAGERIMSATRRPALDLGTPAVGVEEARHARDRFEWAPSEHPVPCCFSCGVQPGSMGVQAGPLPDGRRYATDWSPPDWSVGEDGAVDAGALWAALDCTAAWFVSGSVDRRVAFTVRYAVDELHAVERGGRYALVAWPAGPEPGWVGRKRHAASAAFAADGTCVAVADSLWVSVGA